MTESMIPGPSEYAPSYRHYVSLVPPGEILSTLRAQMDETRLFLRGLTEAQGGHRYAPGKWSVKEIVGHMSDSERVFAYRALCIARGDATRLAGFDQDEYVRQGEFDARTLGQMAAEYHGVRAATLSLLESLRPEAWLRRGTANENEVTVRALAFIMAGHEHHHLEVIRTKYFQPAITDPAGTPPAYQIPGPRPPHAQGTPSGHASITSTMKPAFGPGLFPETGPAAEPQPAAAPSSCAVGSELALAGPEGAERS